MRFKTLLHAIVLAGAFALAGAAAQAQEKVLWLKTEWPPVFMQNGQGFGDQSLAWLIERLPGYAHEIRGLPLPRLLKLMEDTEATVCANGLLRTPAREVKYLISSDLMRLPALGLVVRTAEVKAYDPLRNSKGEVEFRRLMQQEVLDGVVNENRTYGVVLDELLRHPVSGKTFARLPKTSGMVSMLAANRVDWALLYPFEAIWLARQEQTAPVLTVLPIAELPSLSNGGITCNRTPLAEKLVAQIDRTLAAHPDEPWLRPMFDWLDPETRQRVLARR
jgi:uncharacterized protein (TIGR02285 family)